MLKAIIVDDENLVRESIKACVDWQAFGYEIAGEAQNATEALALEDETRPALALVDIHLPGMNGLDLIKALGARRPALKAVILTGYASFDYARAAINSGVVRYLLKPIDPAELGGVLMEVGAQIAAESQKIAYVESLQQQASDRHELLREQYARFLLTGEPAGFAFEPQKARAFWPALEEGPVQAVVADRQVGGNSRRDGGEGARGMILGAALAEALPSLRFAGTLIDDAGRSIILFRAAPGESDEALRALVEAARLSAAGALGCGVTVGVGGVAAGPAEVKISYRQALRALGQRLLAGPDRTVLISDAQDRPPQAHLFAEQRELLIHMRTGDVQELGALVRSSFEAAAATGSLDVLAVVAGGIAAVGNIFCLERGLEPMLPGARETLNLARLIDDFGCRSELETWLESRLADVAREAHRQSRAPEASAHIKAIREHVEDNLPDPDLSLDTIAARVFLNPNYLSNLFKRETGMLLSAYITERRMERARMLIGNGLTSIERLAEETGYRDCYYFSKCFKKHFGVPVSRYIGG
jgi:two-component system response regulator YesN